MYDYNSSIKRLSIDFNSPSSSEVVTKLKWDQKYRKLVDEEKGASFRYDKLVDAIYQLTKERLNEKGSLDENAKNTLAPIYLKFMSLNMESIKMAKQDCWNTSHLLAAKLNYIYKNIGKNIVNDYNNKVDILNLLKDELGVDGPYSQILAILQGSGNSVDFLCSLSKGHQDSLSLLINAKMKAYQRRLEKPEGHEAVIDALLNDEFLPIYLLNDPDSIWKMSMQYASDVQLSQLLVGHPSSFKKFHGNLLPKEASAIAQTIENIFGA